MIKEENLILDQAQLLQKIKRIAFEIYENNAFETDLVVAGVIGTGYKFAQILSQDLKEISPLNVLLVQIKLNKEDPLKSEIELDCPLEQLADKTVVITDDVLNTGRTFIQSLKPFLNISTKKIQTAVLVNRSHKLFPVSADYNGIELATTLSEHIKVMIEDDHKAVYLY
ncbi:MAG: phosphoribosyltransferase family protein [Candidatus Cyclobacteriaceae bacterium M3_2C_046]